MGWYLLACVAPGADTALPKGTAAGDTADTVVEDTGPPADTSDSSDPTDSGVDTSIVCAEADAFEPQYADTIARWAEQDGLGGWPEGAVVFVGSSTMRRWEGLAESFADHAPIQRGFGGAQLGEVARAADTLVNVHRPRAVVVYAGANDVTAGVSASIVVDRLRCLRARVPSDTPLFFVSLLPNPARWEMWSTMEEVNAAAAADASLVYVDVATPLLATGAPPATSLFVSDGLHLSAEGYALWDGVLRATIDANLAPAPVPAPEPLGSGTRLLIDLGPQDGDDGEASPSPDHLGQHWNNWFARDGGAELLPGEQRIDLVDDAGGATGIDLVVAGGVFLNGRQNGGLLWPDEALLGSLAVGSATGDFAYSTGDDSDQPGAFQLRGLDPLASYELRLFASRDDTEVRRTTFTVGDTSVTLQTSGAGAGDAGGNGNDDDVATFTGVRPSAWGTVGIDLSIDSGTYAYLSLIELTVE